MTRFLALFVLVCTGNIWAQNPFIDPSSVTNAASYLTRGQPGFGLAQGGMFVLKGAALGDCGTAVASSFPLPTTLGRTSMKITVGSTTVDAIMIYVVTCRPGAPDQLAGIVPSNTPTGNGTLTVSFNGRTSSAPVTIVANQFGIFTINQQGKGAGVFTDPGFAVNTMTNAAHPGDLLFIWGTGLGAISSSDAAAPPVGDLSVPVEVYVGNVKANVSYKGRSGCCSSIDQILFTVPQGVQGCFVPVVVKAGNSWSNFASVSIAPAGKVCSDPQGFAPGDLAKASTGMTVAYVNLTNGDGKFSFPSGSVQGTLDLGEGHVRSYPPNGLFGTTAGAIGGAGTGVPSTGCIVYAYQSNKTKFFDIVLDIGKELGFNNQLDAGAALNFKGAGSPFSIPRSNPPDPFEYQSDGPIAGSLPPLFMGGPQVVLPGAMAMDNGSGGRDAGPFTASITIPGSGVNWTNQDAINNISRSQDLVVNWTGGGPTVAIFGTSANTSSQASATFECLANGSAGTFTIPAMVLSSLPASGTGADVNAPIGSLAIGTSLSAPARFTARGIDVGFFNWTHLSVKNVNYQ